MEQLVRITHFCHSAKILILYISDLTLGLGIHTLNNAPSWEWGFSSYGPWTVLSEILQQGVCHCTH